MSGDGYYMELALEEAKKARAEGEVPIGAVIVYDGKVLARGYNRTECERDPTSHAEIAAIRRSAGKLDSWRLTGATLYVTLEPCTMCIGAMILARIDRLVFGCRDPKSGAVGSLYDISAEKRLNHRIEVSSGIMEKECGEILREFFRDIRDTKKEQI